MDEILYLIGAAVGGFNRAFYHRAAVFQAYSGDERSAYRPECAQDDELRQRYRQRQQLLRIPELGAGAGRYEDRFAGLGL